MARSVVDAARWAFNDDEAQSVLAAACQQRLVTPDEVDGAHHMDERHWAADLRRQNEVWIVGDRILRFAAFELRNHPVRVVTQLRAALVAAGWSPSR